MRPVGDQIEFSIRPVQEADAAAIVALLNPIIRAGNNTVIDEPVSMEDQVAFIRGFPDRGVFHAAVGSIDQEILGIQDVMPLAPRSSVFRHVGEISTFVALAAQRKGIGQGLSRATFAVAKARGFIKLRATVRADNPQAVAFYRSQGFEVIGLAHKHALVQGRYVDEVLLEKFLD